MKKKKIFFIVFSLFVCSFTMAAWEYAKIELAQLELEHQDALTSTKQSAQVNMEK